MLCCEEEAAALSWTAGIRLAKYGLQLRDNFHKAKMTQFKLEDLTAPDGAKPKAEVRTTLMNTQLGVVQRCQGGKAWG